MKRQWHLDRLRAIEREFKVAQQAAGVLKKTLGQQPSFLSGENLKPADAMLFERNLEATYLLRLFAEFEQALRDWWHHGLGKSGKTPASILI